MVSPLLANIKFYGLPILALTNIRPKYFYSIALLGDIFHRIMIHSKYYFSGLVGRKCIVFCLTIEPYWELILDFWKMHCNTPLHCKMHFTDISQSMMWPNIVYYTKLKLSRIFNHFAQKTYLSQIILLKISRRLGW